MKKLDLKKFGKVIGWILIVFLTFMGFSIRWMLTTWSELTFEEVLFQLSTLQGTGNGMISQYLIGSVVPTVIFIAIIFVCRFAILKWCEDPEKKIVILKIFFALAGTGLFLVNFFLAANKLGLWDYIMGQLFPGTFIAENYVNPENVNIEFPEKKRNLIYIFMESGETTYADKENGGAFDKNVIPELTQISLENENFSGDSGTLNGGVSLYGATWTMAGIFAQTSGLPLRTGHGKNGMSTMESFAPDMTALGDILENNGYNQVFMIGSPAIFGGRELYFNEHGNFNIMDYYYMRDNGKIPEDYYVFWGYEDQKLFTFAKEELLELADKDEPFNFTMLTVDTHFEDGYVCKLCGKDFDDQYSNVFACSSKQISEFIGWIREQDFYENTTVVIAGDHPTMDMDYCLNIDPEYQRKVYTSYINADATPESQKRREYSTFDLFPTTLAALGAKIEGNRLGLGTNLFSGEQTLLEKYGIKRLNDYLRQKSEFLNELMNTMTSYYTRYIPTFKATVDVEKAGEEAYDISVSGILDVGEGIDTVDLYIKPTGADEDIHYPMSYDGFKRYKAQIDKAAIPDNFGHIRVVANGMSGEAYTVVDFDADIYLLSDTFIGFLAKLKEYQDEGRDISILMAANSDVKASLTVPMKNGLNALGFETDFSELDKQSYYGVIDNGTVVENAGRSYLTYKGAFKDGTPYIINSGGAFAGRTSHLVVHELDYSMQLPGLDFLIYDNTNNRVINNMAYNTMNGEPDVDLKMTGYDAENKILSVKITNVKGVAKWDRTDNTVIKFFDPADQGTLGFNKMILNPEEHSFSADIDISNFISDRIQLQLNCVGTYGKFRVTESITSLEFLQYSDVAEYLDYLGKRENLAVFMSIKSGGLEKLDDNAKVSLKNLGLKDTELFADSAKCGYTAVIENGKVVLEEIQESPKADAVEVKGSLSDGTSYELGSAGYKLGAYSNIVINGTDYSLNRRGLNIVVYDTEKGEVVDTVIINADGEYIVSR